MDIREVTTKSYKNFDRFYAFSQLKFNILFEHTLTSLRILEGEVLISPTLNHIKTFAPYITKSAVNEIGLYLVHPHVWTKCIVLIGYFNYNSSIRIHCSYFFKKIKSKKIKLNLIIIVIQPQCFKNN